MPVSDVEFHNVFATSKLLPFIVKVKEPHLFSDITNLSNATLIERYLSNYDTCVRALQVHFLVAKLFCLFRYK